MTQIPSLHIFDVSGNDYSVPRCPHTKLCNMAVAFSVVVVVVVADSIKAREKSRTLSTLKHREQHKIIK